MQYANMNRRSFMKHLGTGVAAFAVQSTLSGAGAAEQNADILGGVDDRIAKYRMAENTLKLVDTNGRPLNGGAQVRICQTRHKFLFGCNLFKLGRCETQQDNQHYAERFAALLNFATLPFYWWNYTARRGHPDDERTERAVEWCQRREITTKGHPLAWNYAEPRWLPDDPEGVMAEQLARIKRCVEKFEGNINIWDVVNEATAYDRARCKEHAPKLTAAIEQMGVGRYVRQAFEAAREANPDATLLINDYRTDPAYAEKVISELEDDRGRPMYDVIGIQSHMHGGYWGLKKTWDVCERFARFGKPLHFTETTLVSGAQGWELQKRRKDPNFKWGTTAEGERRQAEQVVEFYRILFSHPAVEAITWWDFTDQNAWQRAPAGLVRADMSPKPAYEELMKLIKGKWWTTIDGKPDQNGRLKLRGFCGDYCVEAQRGDARLEGGFRLDKGMAEQTVRLHR